MHGGFNSLLISLVHKKLHHVRYSLEVSHHVCSTALKYVVRCTMKSIKSHLWCFETCFFFNGSDSCESHTPSSPAKGTLHSNKNTGTQTHFTRTRVHSSHLLGAERLRNSEPQSHRLKLTPLFIERKRRWFVCVCVRVKGSWILRWINFSEWKRESGGRG